VIFTVTPNPVLDRTLTVAEVVLNEMTRAQEIREDWGGKGFNVSRALLALGTPSVATGFVGGTTGEKLTHGLHSLGIETDLVTIAGETRTNIVITDAVGKSYVKVNEAGPTITAEELETFFARVESLARPGDIWALCGSLPPGVPDDFYARLIALLRSRGARTILDTSGKPLQQGLKAVPTVIKPNLPEAAAWLGRSIHSPTEAVVAVDNFLKTGITMVGLSLGAEGLLLASEEARVWACPPAVKARNPVGAGDALVAGLIWALGKERPLPEVARWGVAAGTAAAMHAGVSVGTRAEVESLYGETTLCPWPSVE
jgi:1-phosphofructokinase family hexose kinase